MRPNADALFFDRDARRRRLTSGLLGPFFRFNCWRHRRIARRFLVVGCVMLVLGCARNSPQQVVESIPAGPFVKADPNPVPKGKGGGFTVLTWETANGEVGEVYVSRDGLPEKKVAAPAASGKKEIDWIYDSTYVFRLYAGRAHKEVLASTTVIRQK